MEETGLISQRTKQSLQAKKVKGMAAVQRREFNE